MSSSRFLASFFSIFGGQAGSRSAKCADGQGHGPAGMDVWGIHKDTEFLGDAQSAGNVEDVLAIDDKVADHMALSLEDGSIVVFVGSEAAIAERKIILAGWQVADPADVAG